MSLWSDYIKECALLEIIEEPWGFITFHKEADGCLWINDMYIIPSERRIGRGTSLIERAMEWGRNNDCQHVSTTVHTASECAQGVIEAAFREGFYLHSANNNLILFVKLIPQKSGAV